MFDAGRIAVIISIIFRTSDSNVMYVLIASASWERDAWLMIVWQKVSNSG
jgi:hypothetical protein